MVMKKELIISPSLLAANFGNLERELEKNK